MQVVESKSALVEAIEKRERPTWTFDAADFLGKGFPRGLKYRMRVARVWEQENSLSMARRYVAERIKESDLTKLDPDILSNAKIAYLMHAVCLNAENDGPAFPSGKWLLEKLTVDELAVMLNHYHEILRLSGYVDLDLTDERLDGLQALLAKHSGSDAPNVALSHFTREQLGELCVRFSVRAAGKSEDQSQPQ